MNPEQKAGELAKQEIESGANYERVLLRTTLWLYNTATASKEQSIEIAKTICARQYLFINDVATATKILTPNSELTSSINKQSGSILKGLYLWPSSSKEKVLFHDCIVQFLDTAQRINFSNYSKKETLDFLRVINLHISSMEEMHGQIKHCASRLFCVYWDQMWKNHWQDVSLDDAKIFMNYLNSNSLSILGPVVVHSRSEEKISMIVEHFSSVIRREEDHCVQVYSLIAKISPGYAHTFYNKFLANSNKDKVFCNLILFSAEAMPEIAPNLPFIFERVKFCSQPTLNEFLRQIVEKVFSYNGMVKDSVFLNFAALSLEIIRIGASEKALLKALRVGENRLSRDAFNPAPKFKLLLDQLRVKNKLEHTLILSKNKPKIKNKI